MIISRISDLQVSSLGTRYRRHPVRAVQALAGRPIGYSAAITAGAVLVLALTLGSTGGMNWPLAAVSLGLLLGGVTAHAVVSVNFRAAERATRELEMRITAEASASRVLAGIRLLTATGTQADVRGADERLEAAARMATGYAAAFVFNLHDAHGVFVPSTRKSTARPDPDQLNLTGDEFEPVDAQTPGAMAARQGSAVVMSLTDAQSIDLPLWAEQAGFTQGIVTPIAQGLDTVGLVYAFTKASELPTLNEIEQLELTVSFVSNISQTLGVARPGTTVAAGPGSTAQPFRIPDSRSARRAAPPPVGISMPGFALNPELERMELDGISLSLSPTEFQLVNALASSPGRPISPDALVESCWGPEARPADNGLDVAIFRLRRKLSKTASGKGLIKTVRGSGYMFVPPNVEGAVPVIAD